MSTRATGLSAFCLRAVFLCLACLPSLTLPAETLEKAIASLVRASGAAPGEVGVAVLDATGTPLVLLDAERPLKPASNQKLLVTAAALDSLGGEWEYVTRIFATGPLVGGEVQGDVRLFSNGEPNVSGRFHDGEVLALFRAWAGGLRDAGVRSVRGELLADARAFDDERFNPTWPRADAGRWFCAEVAPLSLNDNCVTVRVHPTSPGALARVELDPPSDWIRAVGAPRTAGSKPRIRIHRRPSEDGLVLELSGSIPLKTRNWFDEVAVTDPAMFYAHAFRRTLLAAGITVEGGVRKLTRPDRRRVDLVPGSEATGSGAAGSGADQDPASVDGAVGPASAREVEAAAPAKAPGVRIDGAQPGERLLVEHRSRLSLDVDVINKRSQNLHAELLLKTLGRESIGDGSREGGGRVVRGFLARHAIDASGLEIADASGLSHSNRVSARVLAGLLHVARGSPWGDIFRRSLAVGGHDGTLSKRFRTYPHLRRSNVRAKTGTINGVSALSGYVAAQGTEWSFSILVNSRRVRSPRALEEQIVDRLHRALSR